MSVRVTVASALDRTAADAEVALFLVDEAVLKLLGTRTPDPFAFFYAPRGLGVMNAAKGLHVVKTPGADSEKGAPGGGGGEGGAFRRLFAATAVFLADLRTGPDGVVEGRFRLPDNLTTFRAMAVASDQGDRMGSGEAPLIVTRPLTLEPVVPRLARAGDRFEVGAIVTNRTAKKLKVRSRIAAAGAGLEVEDEGDEKVTIDPGKSRRLSFPVTAMAAGQPAIELTRRPRVEEKGRAAIRDAVRLPAHHRRAQAHGRRCALWPDRGRRLAGCGAGDARCAGACRACRRSRPISRRAPPADSKTRCVTCSSIRTNAWSSSTRGSSRSSWRRSSTPTSYFPEWPRDKVVAEANATVSKIGELSTYDGGFRQWPSLRNPDPYLSAYTMLALIEARDAGIPVSGDRLRELAGYLKREIDMKRREAAGRRDGARAERIQTGERQAQSGASILPFTDGDALTAMLLARENRRRGASDLGGILAQADLERMHRYASDLGSGGQLFLATALNEMLRTDPRVGTLVGQVPERREPHRRLGVHRRRRRPLRNRCHAHRDRAPHARQGLARSRAGGAFCPLAGTESPARLLAEHAWDGLRACSRSGISRAGREDREQGRSPAAR